MRAVCGLLLLCWLAPTARAQGTPAPSRESFDAGVREANAGHWAQAAEAFEQALAHGDRPAIRYNLVLAYDALARPHEVVRHAEAFLAFPEEPHRAEARAHVERLLAEARAALEVEASAAATPADAPAPLTPSPAITPPTTPTTLDRPSDAAPKTAESAPSAALPLERTAPERALPPPLPDARWRTRLAWSFGVLGASLTTTAIVTYAVAQRRADALAAHDPYRAGFLSKSDSYLRLTNAIIPLALSGAGLMAAAVPLGPHSTRHSRVWAWTSLGVATAALAAGIALTAAQPASLGQSPTLEEPTRSAGVLLMSAAIPLLSYSGTFMLRQRAGSAEQRSWQQAKRAHP